MLPPLFAVWDVSVLTSARKENVQGHFLFKLIHVLERLEWLSSMHEQLMILHNNLYQIFEPP